MAMLVSFGAVRGVVGLVMAGLGCFAFARGCQPAATLKTTDVSQVAPGISTGLVRQGLASVRVVDVDLSQPGVRVEIAADDLALREGKVTGRARSVADWVQSRGAVAGINGGFFGENAGADFKEIVGLLKLDGRVRSTAPSYHSRLTGQRYSRSALGFTRSGRPRMAWATGSQSLEFHDGPVFQGSGESWTVNQALACGPRLIHGGQVMVTDSQERLASPGSLPRTFVGYGGEPGNARHLVLCTGDFMEFADCARFLDGYFRRQHGIACSEAMCFDGGSSTQMAWKAGGAVNSEPDNAVTVPTAVLVFAR